MQYFPGDSFPIAFVRLLRFTFKHGQRQDQRKTPRAPRFALCDLHKLMLVRFR